VTADKLLPELPLDEAEDILDGLVEAYLLQAVGLTSDGRFRYCIQELLWLFARTVARTGTAA
jgi:hypothetical protein